MRKTQKGKCGARMTPAQKVAHREQAFSRYQSVAGQSSVRFGLDWGLRAAAIAINVDRRLRQKSPVHRSARSLHGIGVRMRYLCACEAVPHLK